MPGNKYQERRFFDNLGPFSLKQIANHINASVYQNSQKLTDSQLKNIENEIFIENITTLKKASDRDISFIAHSKYVDEFFNTKAKACIANEKLALRAPQNIFVLVADSPKLAYAQILRLFYSSDEKNNKFHTGSYYLDPSSKLGKDVKIGYGSYIGKNVVIGDNVQIHPNTYIGDKVIIGDNSIIYNSVSIINAIIGEEVTIHSGVRIGQDGFGYVTEKGIHNKVLQIGRVIIGDQVEIGANSTIDRGSLGDTVIGDMCKLDNLVQIGHNVILGKGCIVVAQVGISGSTIVGDYAVLGGQVGIADNLHIGDFVQIAAKSGVMKDVSAKEIVAGSPAQPIKKFWKQTAILQKLSNRS